MSLRYRTNGPEFDFPISAGLPAVRYVLASTPRCGSNMLARALWHTGAAGFAEDYFADGHVLDYFERWGFTSADPELLTGSYIRELMMHRTSPNGAFGIRVHSGHLRNLEVDLHKLLSSPQYIWIKRRDRLRQAISYVLAEQTGAWILDGIYLPVRDTFADPRYSYTEIRDHLRRLDRDVAAWEEYFARRGVTPHIVCYEELLENYQENVSACLAFLGINARGRVPGPGIRRQAGALTEQWVELYRRDDTKSRPRIATGW
jgi:trehalose 2-sulfotransferase